MNKLLSRSLLLTALFLIPFCVFGDIFEAAMNGDTNAVTEYIKSGGDVNAKDNGGYCEGRRYF
jgi:hypothetical protein